MNIDYTLYPNAGGILGQTKVQIPDGVTTQWPDGDALVNNFIYKDGKLSGFVDTKALIENDSKTTVLPYDFVDITVDKRLETLMSFNAGERCKHLNINYEIYLPKGYKKLEYLESTGTQYIDTGIKLSNESEVTCEFLVVEGNAGSVYLFGDKQSYKVDDFSLFVNNEGKYGGFIFGETTKHIPFNFGEKQKATLNKLECSIGNSILAVNSSAVFESPRGCFMLCLNNGYFMKARVYSFSISRAGEIQVDYVPALDPSGAPCMYDIISQEPFYNKGTGQFLYPVAESQVVTSDLDEIFYARKTAHGIQKLYHVPENFSGSKDEYAIENGFKQLVEPPMPTEGYWIPEWTETDTQLICNWVETDV